MANLDLKNPSVQKTILGLLAAVAVLGVFFFTHFLPFGYPNTRERLDALKADYQKKSTDLARARATVADLPRFEAEYDQLHERWTMAAELLPADKQLPALLRRITLAGQQTGVQFLVFRPAPLKPEAHYSEMPISISVNGGYHEVGSFLAELANLRRIVTVANVHLKGLTTKSDDANITTAAEFTASAYSLAGAAPAPSPAATTKEGEAHARKES